MKRPTVILELSPGRVEAVRASRGRVKARQRIDLDRQAWDQAWQSNLQPLDQPLKSLFASLGVARPMVIALHHSPSALADVHSAPTAGQAATDAAKLALVDAAPFTLADNPFSVAVISRDRSGAPRQTHALACAESDASVDALARWIERAGGQVAAVAPVETVVIRALARSVTGVDDERVCAALHLGDEVSILAAGSPGRLHFIRRIDVGLNMLIDALTRPVRVEDEKTITLTLDEARSLLHRVGAPRPDDDVDAARGLRGSHILPLIQPMLQRLVVEIKQSLRFGLAREDHDRVELLIAGVGAGVPNLDRVLAAETGLNVNRCEISGCAALAPGAQGDAIDEVARRGCPVNLLPQRLTASATAKRIKRAAVLGAAAALAMIAADAAFTWRAMRQTQAELASLASDSRNVQTHSKQLQRAAQLVQTALETQTLVQSRLGAKPDWLAFLSELTRLTPGRIQLTEIAGDRREGKLGVSLTGFVLERGHGSARDALTGYIKRLEQSALTKSVELGATQRQSLDGFEAQRFDALISLYGQPLQQGAIETKERSP